MCCKEQLCMALGARVTLGERAFGLILTLSDYPSWVPKIPYFLSQAQYLSYISDMF